MSINLTEHLRSLCTVPGLSAYEAPIRDAVRQAWEPFADEMRVDRFGSLWAIQNGSGRAPRPRVMVAAHMDTIGLMVTRLDGAFLRVTEVGGIDPRVMLGQPVRVHASNSPEPLPAIVGSRPPHVLKGADHDKVIALDELVVDAGLPADTLAGLVRIGDLISFAQGPFQMQDDLLVSSYLDNRASVAAVTLALEILRERRHDWDVVAVATAQEEENLGGALTSAFELEPQIAIVLDVTFATAPGVADHRAFALGKGPTLGYGPNLHPKLHKALLETARRAELPHQVEVMARHSGTDAYAIQVSRTGIPTGLIGIPLRNMHTPVEMVSVRDVERAGRLLAAFLAGLDAGFLDTLTLD
jgi:tetrahedral aminopeptidase